MTSRSRSEASAGHSTDLVVLLAMCPALAVSDTVANSLALGIAAIFVYVVAGACIALLANWIDTDVRLAACLLVVASTVAAVELLMRAWFHEAWNQVGVFLPLLAANMAFVLLTYDLGAPRAQLVGLALRLGVTIAAALVILGFARELVGRGSLLHGAGVILGGWASGLEMNVFRIDMGFLLAMLPPGAFIALGLLIATRNWLVRRFSLAA